MCNSGTSYLGQWRSDGKLGHEWGSSVVTGVVRVIFDAASECITWIEVGMTPAAVLTDWADTVWCRVVD